jgi:tight adherence protein C
MGIAAVSFLAIFLLIASGGLILFYREAMIQRISAVITPSEKQGNFRETMEQASATLGVMVQHLERVVPKSQAEISVVQQRLVRAG